LDTRLQPIWLKELKRKRKFNIESLVFLKYKFLYLQSEKNHEQMSKICQITGKKRMVGNNVSHANNKTKRTFEVNLFKKKFLMPETEEWITLRVSANGLKTINKIGIEEAVKRGRKNGLIA